jgi:hypothetical protein
VWIDLHEYMLTTGGLGPIPQRIFDEVVKANLNVFAVSSGHYHDAYTRTDAIDDNGDGQPDRTVYSMLFDYQGLQEGGLGYLRLLHFDNKDGRMIVRTYSPSLDMFDSQDPALTSPEGMQEFTIPYSAIGLKTQTKTLATDSFRADILTADEVGKVAQAPSGSVSTVDWKSLTAGERDGTSRPPARTADWSTPRCAPSPRSRAVRPIRARGRHRAAGRAVALRSRARRRHRSAEYRRRYPGGRARSVARPRERGSNRARDGAGAHARGLLPVGAAFDAGAPRDSDRRRGRLDRRDRADTAVHHARSAHPAAVARRRSRHGRGVRCRDGHGGAWPPPVDTVTTWGGSGGRHPADAHRPGSGDAASPSRALIPSPQGVHPFAGAPPRRGGELDVPRGMSRDVLSRGGGSSMPC